MFTLHVDEKQLQMFVGLLDVTLKTQGLSSLVMVTELYNVLLAAQKDKTEVSAEEVAVENV